MGAVQDSYITVAWLVLLVVLLVIEIITVGLTTIWGAGGALAALILNILDVPFAGQVVAFFIVTILLLVFTRPFAMRFINTRRLKTNYEGTVSYTHLDVYKRQVYGLCDRKFCGEKLSFHQAACVGGKIGNQHCGSISADAEK